MPLSHVQEVAVSEATALIGTYIVQVRGIGDIYYGSVLVYLNNEGLITTHIIDVILESKGMQILKNVSRPTETGSIISNASVTSHSFDSIDIFLDERYLLCVIHYALIAPIVSMTGGFVPFIYDSAGKIWVHFGRFSVNMRCHSNIEAFENIKHSGDAFSHTIPVPSDGGHVIDAWRGNKVRTEWG
jgi:hypothetical protein